MRTLTATALSLILSAPAFAGMPCEGMIEPGNMRTVSARSLNYAVMGVAYREHAGIPRRSVWIMVPAETRGGRPLSAAEAATEYWRTRRNYGIFSSPEAAHACVARIVSE